MPELPARGHWSKENDEAAVEAGYESWQSWCLYVEAEKGFEICGARNSRGEPCPLKEGWGVKEKLKGRCKHHGGSSPVGDAHPRWVDGTHSRYQKRLKGDVAEAFQAYVADPNILGLQDEIALVRAHVEGILAEWPETVCSAAELRSMAERAIAAIQNRDAAGMASSLNELLVNLEPFAMAPFLSRELDRKLDLLRKLVDTNLKREKTEYEQVSSARLGMWTTFIQETILEYVKDPEDRQLIVLKIQQWVG